MQILSEDNVVRMNERIQEEMEDYVEGRSKREKLVKEIEISRSIIDSLLGLSFFMARTSLWLVLLFPVVFMLCFRSYAISVSMLAYIG